jgi:hypothetical protein
MPRKCKEDHRNSRESRRLRRSQLRSRKRYQRSVLETWNRREAREENSAKARYPSSTVRVPTLSTILHVSLALSTAYCSLRAAIRDRSNIGNAAVAGLATDLRLVGLQYNVAVAMFFISYCTVEIPRHDTAYILIVSI